MPRDKRTHHADPQGELVTRSVAMPAETNANGDIFGGWIMSEMDLGGAIEAKQYTHLRVATVAVEGMVFHNPVNVGDLVSCYAKIVRVGNTSIAVNVETWVERYLHEDILLLVTEGVFTYVAIDENGRPTPIPKK